MIKFILLSHGPFCEGLLKTLEMIAGPQTSIQALPLNEGQTPDNYRNELTTILKKSSKDCLVFCDIKGGTPYNTAAFLKSKFSFELITGMNLPMLASVITSDNDSITTKELSQIAISPENNGIELINLNRTGDKKIEKLSINKNR